jgi:peptide/nickel transport system ATP-binding protein
MSQNFVEIRDLEVSVTDDAGANRPIVQNVNLSLAKGKVLALIGESGSGKTTIALSLMGYARSGCRFTKGSVIVDGKNLINLPVAERRRLRGNRIAYIPQSAAASFNPAYRLIEQIIEPAVIHETMSRAAASNKARALFAELGLPDPDRIGERFPHEVSGGQLQRMIAAMAMINDPDLIILDEPTTALDVTTQIEVLRAFKAMVTNHAATAVYVSHDLAVVAQIADQIAVLKDGRLQEVESTQQVLDAPIADYTKDLLRAAEPHLRNKRSPDTVVAEPLVTVKGLDAGYGPVRNGAPLYPVLEDLSFSIEPGEIVGVIGESGSGKSTLARVLAGIHPATRGELMIDGRQIDLVAPERRTKVQRQTVQMVFQMADTALNPSQTIMQLLRRPLDFYDIGDKSRREARVLELMDLVRIPRSAVNRRPSELSGGQKQRVNLARALAADSKLLLCDEVTSALDTIVSSAVLDLLTELRRELGLSMLFISHDLGTVSAICDKVLVMYRGRILTQAAPEHLGNKPVSPYTEMLIRSVPQLRPGWLEEAEKSMPALREAVAQL